MGTPNDPKIAEQFFRGLRWEKSPGLDRIEATFSGPVPEAVDDYLGSLPAGEALLDRGEAKMIAITGKSAIEKMVYDFDINFTGKDAYKLKSGLSLS